MSAQQDKIVSQYIADNIGSDLKVIKLARLLHLSSGYFCKAFTKTKGVTPHQFVLNQRITSAADKLRQQHVSSFARLAEELGFADQAHFSNAFRKIVGCSPSQFARNPCYRRSDHVDSN